ncbi:competence protein TfoX [Prolixibacteraceae bacterium JC049]|nr:competence protein TfoX [Prolixibacteraceae bacterium JC049]
MPDFTQLTQLPNIGKVLAEKLFQVGIETMEDLQTIGSENAFARLKTVDKGACFNMLCALEGAIQGIRWHKIDESRKDELKAFYAVTKK